MNTFEETAGLCALNRIFGFEPKIAHALLSHIGSACEIFGLPPKDMDNLLGPYSKYRGAVRRSALDEAKKELESLHEKEICFIGCTCADFPQMLRLCDDHPVGLYVRSRTPANELFAPSRMIAVIGTRDLSPYGREWCRNIVHGLASSPDRPVIVSGLALGTDICAHTAAVEAGLPTIGVMATGPEKVYPYRHNGFADRLVLTPGCGLITDYPPDTAPLPVHFLRRNRIIAGMSEAVVLVESKIKGGGMMTARLAYSYNRDVYALPGRVDDVCSKGCNLLIREKVAEAVTDTESFIRSLGMRPAGNIRSLPASELLQQSYAGRTSNDRIEIMARMITRIRRERGITIEEIAVAENLDFSTVSSLAAILEADGFISTDILQRCCIKKRISE